MTQQHSVADTLNLAADLIEERGWGHGADSMYGRAGLCLMGAIHAATFGRFDSNYRASLTCPAGQAVMGYLHLDAHDQDAGWTWNDDQWQVHRNVWSVKEGATNVVEVLRATALIESARERQAAEVSA